MVRVLSLSFFNRPALSVARSLLGKYLVRRIGRKTMRVLITEVEAYTGPEDKACHAHRGKTKRNAVMFGPAGVWYVYFVYGMHWMLNVVTGPKDFPAAVLIRGIVLQDGTEINGPAKLTKALRINGLLNGKSTAKRSGLWIEDSGVEVPEQSVRRTPRIGVTYAKEWARKPYRFMMKHHG